MLSEHAFSDTGLACCIQPLAQEPLARGVGVVTVLCPTLPDLATSS